MVAFLSFAVMSGLGAQHPLLALADRLRRPHRVPLGPLTTFYDATVEDAEDAEKLALAWQPAKELGRSLGMMIAVLESDEQARALLRRAEVEQLRSDAEALLALCAGAGERRLRLSYVL